MTFYAIFGLHLMNGSLEFRCRTTPTPPSTGKWEIYENLPDICGKFECPKE